MAIKDGGPAFPTFELERVYADNSDRFGRELHVPVGGMSLRDYFAGQALLGLACSFMAGGADSTALFAYEMADSMLAVREMSPEAREALSVGSEADAVSDGEKP